MTLYLYRSADSYPYRLNPISKILLLLLTFQIAFTLEHPLYLAALLILLLLGMLAWGLLFRVWSGIWFLMVVLFLFTSLLWGAFYWRGPEGGFFGKGLLFGAGMGIRLDLMLLAGVLFLTTTRVESLTAALSRLGVPYRAGFALTLAFRLVPVFLDTALTVAQAQKCRGWDVDTGGPIRRIRKYAPLIVPIFISSLQSADHLSVALESKGFGNPRPRGAGSGRLPRFGWRDAGGFLFIGSLDLVVVALRLWGYGIVS